MSSANLANDISNLRAQLKQRAEEINASFDPNLPVDSLLIDRSDSVDTALQTLWLLCDLDSTDSSLVAVGGYGRGELFPHSDVDILVLQPNESTTDDSKVAAFVSALWDLGLKIGHSVRSIDECIDIAKGDLTVVTTYLETRVLAGDPSLLETLKLTIEQSNLWPSATFFAAKREEQETRHDKYGRTGYSLEPNVKSSPGGLRDLQVIGWITQRHFGCSINELPTGEFLSVEERGQLAAGKDFLSRVRAALHIMTGRDEDRLLFEHQRSLASLWGFEDEAKLGVEQFMQLYFRQVQSVVHLTDLLNTIFDQKLLHDCESPPVIIDEDFELIDERIAARRDNVFSDKPANLLRLFVIIANDERIAKIDPHTIRLLRQSAQLIDDDYRSNEVNRQLFREVLKGQFWMTKQLRRMLRHGILARYLPEFGQVVGQMQFDMFHTYTVDAHTMEVIANTRRFLRADYTDKFPVTTRIAQRLRKPLLLFVAALYHDIGKGRGGDHSELGAVDARLFCEQHFFNEADTELVVWLVKNHLFMSSFSQRRDISDPAEIQRFAEIVGTEERLNYLFTLTVADINGTNPDLWNAWRSSLLRQLYTETRRALRRGLTNPIGRVEVIDATRKSAAQLLENRGFLEDDIEGIWSARGDDYFLREQAEDIAWHTEAIADHGESDEPLTLVRQSSESPVANATQIFVHAKQIDNVFARVCSSLEVLDLSIHDARIYSGTDGATLDTFFVLRGDGSPIDGTAENFHQIANAINKSLASKKVAHSQQRIARTLRSFALPTDISFSMDDDRQLTIMELSAADRPGLLAQIALVISQHDVSIQAAKIQTLGERVEDIFFLNTGDSGALLDSELCDTLKTNLCTAIDEGLAA